MVLPSQNEILYIFIIFALLSTNRNYSHPTLNFKQIQQSLEIYVEPIKIILLPRRKKIRRLELPNMLHLSIQLHPWSEI